MSEANNQIKILPFEKVYSIFSYCTMGIAGLVLLLISYFTKKKLRYFLEYNIFQSVLIGIILAIFKFFLDKVLQILANIPFVDGICGAIYTVFVYKFINLGILSFNLLELIVYGLIIYISIGIIKNKIYFVPVLTKLTQTIIKMIYK